MPLALTEFHPTMSYADLVSALNENMALLSNLNRSYITRDDKGTDRILIGAGANDFQGMKVSKAGIDVNKATDDQLIFNSSQDTFKIVQSNTVNVNVTATGVNYTSFITINHGLGYAPLVIASGSLNYNGTGAVTTMLPFILLSTITSNPQGVAAMVGVQTTSTQIIFRVDLSFNTVTLVGSIKYYMLQETAT